MRNIAAVLCLALVLLLPGSAGQRTLAAVPNTVSDWNAIAVDTVVGAGALQNEGFVYLAYVSAAVYDAVVAIEGGYTPYGSALPGVPNGASVDAAVIEAAYRTLLYYFPTKSTTLDPLYAAALQAVPNGQSKSDGQAVGLAAAMQIVQMRANDGRLPVGTLSSFPTKNPGPGVWRLTPPAYAPPQVPWLASMTPFVLDAADRFRPDPPPSLQSQDWVNAFNEVKAFGASVGSVRTPEETATAVFWAYNVNRQFNWAVRDVIDREGLALLESARLQAMVNVVGADVCIAWVNAKYHYLFWRPVTAIDPTSVKPTGDGFGPSPEGFDDGNPLTEEQAGWRPLLTTPNHPEYPSAHSTVTSAMAEVFSTFLDTNRFNLTLHGSDSPTPNANAVQTFPTPSHLRQDIIDARVWGGIHYRFSNVAGVVLGRQIAKYDLRTAFRPVR